MAVIDYYEGDTFTKGIKDGLPIILSGTRTKSVEVNNGFTGYDRLIQGITDCGLDIYDTHEDDATLEIISIQPVEKDGRIICKYQYQNSIDRLNNEAQEAINSRSDQRTITYDYSLTQVLSNQDWDGDDIVLQWVDLTTNQTVEYVAEFQVQVPVVTMTITDIVQADPSAYTSYIGKINDDTWNGKDAHMWMCTNFCYVESDNGEHWQVTAQFAGKFDQFGWDVRVYLKRKDGTIPDSLVEGTGKDTIQVYEEADFDLLLTI